MLQHRHQYMVCTSKTEGGEHLCQRLFQIWRDNHPPVAGISHMAQQNDSITRELLEVQTFATVLAGNLRMRLELVRGLAYSLMPYPLTRSRKRFSRKVFRHAYYQKEKPT